MNNFLSSDLRLVKAPELLGEVVPGQPLLFQYWGDQVAVFEEPTIFLSEKVVAVGRSPSKNTWEATGYDLLTWFQWCQLTGIDWRDATEADRQQFAGDYAAASDSKTINRKLTAVRRFYDFCRAEGWYHRDIGSSLEQRLLGNRTIDEDALAHTRSTGTVKEKDPLLRKVGRNVVVRPLQLAQVRKLLKHLGPAPEAKEDRRLVRDRLMAELALFGGTRLGDVVGLTTLKFLSITVEPHQMLAEFPLIVVGKGSVTRQVAVPGWLVVAVQKYIAGERAESVRQGKKRGTSGAKPTTSLFLAHPGSKGVGKPISRSAIQKMFELACRQCGITEKVEVVDPETGKTHIKTVAAHSFHDLRHNCAVLTYHAQKAIGNPEPWKIVQIKLGHKSVKVTMDVYLAHVEIFGQKQGLMDIRRLIGIQGDQGE
jgi:integrase